MTSKIKNLVVFISICTVVTLLLAATNFITSPRIKKNAETSANKALLEVMPEGMGFEVMDISSYTLPATVKEVHKETSGKGYVVQLVTTGYDTDMVIMCGVSSDGIITGAVCVSSKETMGKQKTYGENFKSKDSTGVDAVEIISGATKTTEAYKNAIKDALNTAIILGGGSVDIRTEEEIFADNLNAAFPDGEKAFEKVFLVEVVEGFDAIYKATNNKGYVFVNGELFVGVKTDGTVVTEGVSDTAIYQDAVAKIESTTFEDIDFSGYTELSEFVVSAKKTASGNFVVETMGEGYGINGEIVYDKKPSNEPIIVKVSMTADYKILDCITVFEAETDGIGDACANESFYGQFVGKTEENYTEIDAISGATLTTDGYKQAIQRAFTAVKTLNGGAK